MKKTAIICDPIYSKHVMSASHVESPARISRIKHIIENSEAGRASIKLKARPATKEEIAWVHDKDYIDSIEETSGKVVPLDPDTTACPVTWDAACMAAGGVIEATKAVLDHKVDNAFAFVRPPGHHAETARAMGFCFFNNIAIAAEYAIRKYGLKRVVIVDFDIHHGNGTQHSFYNRSDVFYISTHRWPFYPGSGSRAEHGEGEGVGYTLNVPFETGDDAELKDIYKRVIIPVIDEYEPELILVSAGYDAHNADPLGGLSLSTEAFDWLTGELKAAAERSCNGKIVMILEGGYNVEALAECAEGALKTLQTS